MGRDRYANTVTGRAYSPASLSFIFKYRSDSDIDQTGSVGLGCTVDKGVEVRVEKNTVTRVFFNNKKIKFPTVASVVNDLSPVPLAVYIRSALPLGSGFGISGASSLACAFAIGRIYYPNYTRLKLAGYAHRAEIRQGTGLGSVGTQVTGGFLLKTTAGIKFRYQRLPFTGRRLYCIHIDKLETRHILSNRILLDKINAVADIALKKINNTPILSLEQILDESYNYCLDSGLLKDNRVKKVIRTVKKNRGHATMAILGQMVLSDIIPGEVTEYPVYKLKISEDSARIL